MKFNNNLVKKNCTIKKAMQTLESSTKKIICVVNENKNLLGTVTDGDIRRSVLNGIDENKEVISIAKKKPFVLESNYDKYSPQDIRKIFIKKKINAIPVLKNKKLIKIFYFEDYFFENFSTQTDIVIPCGGYGKRLYPLTKKIPKCLVKIKKNKTILDIILKKFIQKNFTNFIFLTYYKKEKIKEFIKKNYNKKKFTNKFYEEKKPLGTAGGLSLLNKKEINKNLLVINSDIITDIDFENLLRYHNKNKSMCTIVTHSVVQKFEFGSIQNESDNFTSISEKPYTNHFINAGIYLFDKSCLNVIKKNQYLDMNNFITLLKKKKYKIKLYHSFERWIDVGTKKNLKDAQKIKFS